MRFTLTRQLSLDGTDATVVHDRLTEERAKVVLFHHISSIYTLTESVIRNADIDKLGIKTGGKLVYNLSYADYITHCTESQEKAG